MSGVGKTSLATQLIREIQDKFNYVVWRSLEKCPTFVQLEDNLIDFLSQQPEMESASNKPKQLSLIKYLQRNRCLVILDDVHNLFDPGKLAGEYKTENQDYATFFKQIQELSHNSCFLLIGWEQPRQVPQHKSKNYPIRSLKLMGLSHKVALKIFKDQETEVSDISQKLIKLYQGNPLWLKILATFMKDLELSSSELLLDHTIVLPEDLKESLAEQFNRLSETETEVITILARETTPVNLAKLLDNSQISSSDLLNAVQSLTRRCLIEKEEKFYTLQPILRHYVMSFM